MGLWNSVKKALIGEPPKPEEKELAVELEESQQLEPESEVSEASSDTSALSGQYRRVRIERGGRGWGGPLVIEPKPGRELIYCVTGGGIHPVAQRIADLTGGEVFDGFKSKADFDQIAVAVIDCGGTARVGVYPMKKVFTVDVHATTPAGPLMKFITEELFVSGVKEENIILLDD